MLVLGLYQLQDNTIRGCIHALRSDHLSIQQRAHVRGSVRRLALWVTMLFLSLFVPGTFSLGQDSPAVARFEDQVQPVLVDYCYRCHGLGMTKGGISFDGWDSDTTILKNRDLWWAVLKNVRAGIMPPANKPRPDPKEMQALANWIKRDVFGLDPDQPDPGRVTVRRLNRVEYRNTIKDLMGIDFKAEEEFPPDDTGYGFDNIGDVLTVSPLLLEKYFQAAETIVKTAVPTAAKVIPERTYRGVEFRGEERGLNGDRLAFGKAAKVSHAFSADPSGDYRFALEVAVQAQFQGQARSVHGRLQGGGS